MDYTTQQMYRSHQDDLLANHPNLFLHPEQQFRSDSLEPDSAGYDMFIQNSFTTQGYRTNASSSSSLGPHGLNGDAAFTHHTYSEPVAAYPTTVRSFDLMNPLSAYSSGNISPLTPADVANHHAVAFGSTGKEYPFDPVLPPLATNSYLQEQPNDDQVAQAVSGGNYYAPPTAHPTHINPGFDQYPTHLSAVPQHLLHHTPQNGDMMFDHYGVDYRTAVSTPTDDSRSTSGFVPDMPAHVEPLSRLRLQPNDPPQDFQTQIRPYLDQYLRAPNRLALGERTIIVMTSRVA